MSELDGILRVWELGYREMGVAFGGLRDENVWRRPAPGLLSVGELAGHVALSEAVCLTGPGPDFLGSIEGTPVKSWLLDRRFFYYPDTLALPPGPELTSRKTREVLDEANRVHAETLALAMVRGLGMEDPIPGWDGSPTWGSYLRYMAFHAGYHAGQMYSVRHLLGEATPDN